jgi:excisionase family DNA binding protein
MRIQSMAEAAADATVRTKPYRVAEVAEAFDVDENTVYRDIRAGRLRALRIGKGRGTLRIPVDAFNEYAVAALTTQALTA